MTRIGTGEGKSSGLLYGKRIATLCAGEFRSEERAPNAEYMNVRKGLL